MTARSRSWTDVGDVLARLRRRWDRGGWLRDHATGTAFDPVRVPVRAPRGDDVLDQLDEVHRWVDRFTRDARRAGFRIETKIITGRRVGRNEVPSALWLDTLPGLVRCLGVTDQLHKLDRVYEATEAENPVLSEWVAEHPARAIEHAEQWPELLATVRWIVEHQSGRYRLRHIDADGIDTKFIQAHRLLLADLLDRSLPSERIDDRYPQNDLVRRYGFLRRPDYVRFRVPSGAGFPEHVSEATLRADEFAAIQLPQRRVLVVENEASYLALPEIEDTVTVFGSGFALTTLQAVVWLADRELVYWGDIDTYGFAILDQLRARFGHVRSILMDDRTLLAHRKQWVTEPKPTARSLPHLTEPESELYRDLIEDRYAHRVRLEQERIRFSCVRSTLADVSSVNG